MLRYVRLLDLDPVEEVDLVRQALIRARGAYRGERSHPTGPVGASINALRQILTERQTRRFPAEDA
ncbi:MAG TPA: hypothetical protein VLT88_06240, partial [Desulfosarcina sp.]|nr:hypothetical protein [Desulfosarcina sp.]